ncbi:MAG: 3-methylornithyl-N6-L-lysine dehydrogenase PylD, partial [bacterium]|nr:3-methylornithyl-N6-L-lysine dehydrogenase PylD [bacterium]
MTRLKVDDIKDISKKLIDYDNELLRKTNHGLRGIACHAAGIDEEKLLKTIRQIKIVVVPIKSGIGIITGFSNTVVQIVRHIGFDGFVTSTTDVAGLAEAV